MQPLKEKISESLGDRLKQALFRSETSPAALARATGISPGQISDAMKNKKGLSKEACVKIAATLGVSYIWLYLGSEDGDQSEFTKSEVPADMVNARTPAAIEAMISPAEAGELRAMDLAKLVQAVPNANTGILLGAVWTGVGDVLAWRLPFDNQITDKLQVIITELARRAPAAIGYTRPIEPTPKPAKP